MQSKDAFSAYHPVVNFLYFALVLLFSMFLLHPLCLAVSLTGAVWYAVILRGKRAVWRSLRCILPVFVLAVGLNPLFNHTGDTVLCYLFSDNPLTWESVAYGFAAGTMLVSVLLWFQCYNAVMTSDKFIYLFGRRIPALSLVLSMALRFVPRFQVQLAAVTEAQKSIGRDISQGKGWQKVRNAVAVLSILVTWALENAMDTADSMKSRGYGLPGRTAFSVYRMDSRDKAALLWLGFCGYYVLLGAWAGGMKFVYFPVLQGVPLTPFSVSFFLAYLALSLTPVLIHGSSAFRWRKQAV